MFSVILTVGLSCAGVLVLLLAVPIQIHLAIERLEKVRTRADVSWLFGAVRFRVRSQRETTPRDRLGGRAARTLWKGLARADLRARAWKYARDILRAIRPRDVSLRARIGMEDPADTGRLWALLGPLDALLARHDARLEPNFVEACFRFRAAASIRLIPGQLLLLTASFCASPPVLKALVAR